MEGGKERKMRGGITGDRESVGERECVCVCERDIERGREGGRERERERERERGEREREERERNSHTHNSLIYHYIQNKLVPKLASLWTTLPIFM